MPVCNRFEVRLSPNEDDSRIVDYLLYTDLPAGTQVVLGCKRTYLDLSGATSLWLGHSERLALIPNIYDGNSGYRGKIDVIASDREAFDRFRRIFSEFPADISTPVSDMFTVVFTVGGRQRLKEFGHNNSALSGDLVSDDGGIKFVQVTKGLHIPVRSDFGDRSPGQAVPEDKDVSRGGAEGAQESAQSS